MATAVRQRVPNKTKKVEFEPVDSEKSDLIDVENKETKQSTSAAGKLSDSVWTPTNSRLFGFISFAIMLTRLYKINEPAEVVFDEVHFGGFASNYLRREYFFDVHPPLGKLMIAALGYFLGYEGNFTFANIGLSYAGTTAPYVAMRVMMVFFGWVTTVMSFMSMLELGISSIAAGFAAMLLIFDMAFCVQTRFILLDSPLMAFIMTSLYCWIRFRKQRNQSFSADWWKWLAATGASIGAATSVKMVGLFTVATLGISTILDLWELADKKRGLSEKKFWKHFGARALCLIGLPLSIYCSSFYAHFAILNRTGPGDGLMSPAFQATLIGNAMHQSSREVHYGQSIRLKSRLEDVYLHSHAHNYPQQHLDGKISSQMQQVTGYPSEDPNNLWKILPEDLTNKNYLDVPVKNGDKVRLLHVKTNQYLMTHDVASPLTRTNMEITVCKEDNKDLMDQAIWKIDITSGGDVLKTKACHIKIFNAKHEVALTNWQQPLPSWGFGQREINGDKRGVDENSKWVVWDIHEPMSEAEAKLKKEAKLPTMSTLQKYIELQKAIIRLNAKLIDNHPFKSQPISWPFVLRGISFWDKGRDARIYMLGNVFAWYISLIGTLVYCGVAIKELYRARRGKSDGVKSRQLIKRTGFLLLAWAWHYLPFFTMVRTLYLHHYLPAYVISTMIAGSTVDYLLSQYKGRRSRLFIYALLASASLVIVWTFFYFSPIIYGSFLKSAEMNLKKWVSTWDWTA